MVNNKLSIVEKKIYFFFVFFLIIFFANYASTVNFNVDVHGGYGGIEFEEKEDYIGDNFTSESDHDAILFGASGEYSFQKFDNIYAGINADWVFGLKDTETWKQDSVEIRRNDLKIFGQFYDARVGYKNSRDNVFYKIYMLGGWDGMRFERENWSPSIDRITEDFSLWKIGGGLDFIFRYDKLSPYGKVAYSYYPDGEVEDSTLPDLEFDAKGTRLDIEFGVTREIISSVDLYLGGYYSVQRLKGNVSNPSIDWRTTLEILTGMIKLKCAF